MAEIAKLVTAIAALVGALAWPIAVFGIVFILRKELKAIAAKVPTALDRMQSIKIGVVEAQLKGLADQAAKNEEGKAPVTPEQIRVAANLQARSAEIGKDQLLSQLDRLSIEYDTVRRTMRGGSERTQEMTKILVQMRGLAPAVSDMMEAYKTSGAAGSRLAAIAMMQMEPEKADIPWLRDRFKSERPFIFYHAALALQNVVDSSTGNRREEAVRAAEEGLAALHSFSETPDANTVHVLEALTHQRRA